MVGSVPSIVPLIPPFYSASMGNQNSRPLGPTGPPANPNDIAVEEIPNLNGEYVDDPNARNLVVCIDGTANQFGLQV